MLRRLILLFAMTAACQPAETGAVIARGRGLEAVALPANQEAGVHEATIRAAFDVGPGLALYLHPRRLARSAGYEGGEPVAMSLVNGLKSSGLVRGTCEPQRDTPTSSPRCDVPEPGYLIRASDILRVSKDTLQVYFAAERFATRSGPLQPPFHFEKIYQLIRAGSSWRVVREARVADDRS
jgi:hypothetical protein